jgi:hypothetical protein
MANLVLLPIEQYRKDGRLARGLQKGATAFARTTTLEALDVGARLATGTQVILERALSSSSASSSFGSSDAMDPMSRFAQQPMDIQQGIEGAYKSLGDNFRSAAQTILAIPLEVYERSGSEVRFSSLFALSSVWLTFSFPLPLSFSGTCTSCHSCCSDRCSQTHDWRFRSCVQDFTRSS